MYGLHADTRVFNKQITQQEYEQEMFLYVKRFVVELVRDRRFKESQVRQIVEDCLDGNYTL